MHHFCCHLAITYRKKHNSNYSVFCVAMMICNLNELTIYMHKVVNIIIINNNSLYILLDDIRDILKALFFIV